MQNLSPFDLGNDSAYSQWRDQKLEQAPTKLEELVVEIDDPRTLNHAEHGEILKRCRKANMAIYVSKLGATAGTHIPRGIGCRFGLLNLDHNRGAEQDAVTAITVQDDELHTPYIPYSNKTIHWHTDGYYNRLDLQDHGLILHCVRPAMAGGENAVMDHEIAYLLMREANPDHVRALMQEDAMLIPKHVVNGEELRPDRIGPVFMIAADGHLHMRYTMRKRNVLWKDDPTVKQAVAWLEDLLNGESEHIHRATLQAGWGLVSNNVLHDRRGFKDNDNPANKRLLYRARYYDRIQGT
ncbi:MAG: TauD/TfdA family dioxygenase [Gammaproteobacteria bacterium]|nr:TauD/TfdA family dioxygenase [Gammaproteobacteria bacterium]